MKLPTVAAALTVLGLAAAHAGATDPAELEDLVDAGHEDILALMGLGVPASEFKDDGDPDTLQVVFLSKELDGPSRVSDDGEVIFFNNASDSEQADLFSKAFDIRVACRLNAN